MVISHRRYYLPSMYLVHSSSHSRVNVEKLGVPKHPTTGPREHGKGTTSAGGGQVGGGCCPACFRCGLTIGYQTRIPGVLNPIGSNRWTGDQR